LIFYLFSDNPSNISSLFRSIAQNNTNEPADASGKYFFLIIKIKSLFFFFIATTVLHPYHPQYQTSLNNLMLLNSQIQRSISPSDLSPQQRPRNRHHHHHYHHRHSTTPRRTQTNPAVTNDEQQTSEHKKNDV
jgi:hypothetical protein